MYEIKKLKDEFERASSAACGNLPAQVRAHGPLIHMLTNYVTVTDCVNAVLAIGGRAICSHAPGEAAQVTSGADALVCNLGGTEYYDAMELSAAQAAVSGIPLVIDPVGCAASDERRKMCLHLTETYHPAAIRGNYAEIGALTDGIFTDGIFTDSGTDEGFCGPDDGPDDVFPAAEFAQAPPHTGSAGLDSTSTLNPAESSLLKAHMTAFARRYDTILIASGAVDLCTDGTRMIEITGGTPALKRITGAGCLSTGVLAAFLASFDAEQSRADAEQQTGAGLTAAGAEAAAAAAGLTGAAAGLTGAAAGLTTAGTSEEEDIMSAGTASRLEAAAAAVRYVGFAGEYAQRAAYGTGTGAGHFHMFLMDFLSASDPVFTECLSEKRTQTCNRL